MKRVLLTKAETAAKLNMSLKWVERYARDHPNELGEVRFGRTIRFDEAVLDEFIERQHTVSS